MKASVSHSPATHDRESWPKPLLDDLTAVCDEFEPPSCCGTSRTLFKSRIQEVPNLLTMAYEAVGTVAKVGVGVSNFKVGDKALISCIASGRNFEMHLNGGRSPCENGDWIVGHMIDGTPAESARAYFSDTCLQRTLTGSDKEPLVCRTADDFLLTGFECGVLNGKVKPGDTVAIVGSGRIGIAALLTVQFYSPANIIMIDPDKYRLANAMSLGATKLVRSDRVYPVNDILRLTGGRGVDVAIETVGIPSTLDICKRIIAHDGCIARMGVHGKKIDLYLEFQWSSSNSIARQLVDIARAPTQLKTVISGRLKPGRLPTPWFASRDTLHHYSLAN